MHRFSSLTLSQKLVSALALFGIAPAMLIAWLTYTRSAATLTEDVGKSYQHAAVALHDTIDRNLFERYGDVQAFGVNEAVFNRGAWYKVGADTNAVAQVANTYVALYGIYSVSMVLDLEGRVIAVNDKDAAGKPVDTAWLYGERYADAAWFKDAVAGRFLTQSGSALTGTVVTDVFDDPQTARIRSGNGKVMGFTAPIRDRDGKVMAVWHNRADFALGSIEYLPQHVRAGTLDRLLLRPVGVLAQLLAEEFSMRRLGRIAQAAVVLVIALVTVDVSWTLAGAVVAIAGMVGAVLTFGGLFVLTSSVSFWSPNTQEFANAFTYGGATVGEFPTHLFPRWLRWFFIGVIPAGGVVYLPAMYALHAPNPLGVPVWAQVLAPLVCVPVLFVAAAVWRLGVRHYESTGS